METVVISDTSCLIILEKIGQLPLLKAAYHKVIVTPVVASEFGQPLPPWIALQSPVNQSLIQLLEEPLTPVKPVP